MRTVHGMSVLIGIGVLPLVGASCRTFVSADAAWERAAAANTKEALVAFVRTHPNTRYTRQALALLERHATARGEYAIAAIRPPAGSASTMTRARITAVERDRLTVDGFVERELDPTTGRLGNMFWNPGAEHTILCTLTFEGHTFVSDTSNPLVFLTTMARGYTYKSGHGVVIEPDGRIISLGSAGRP